MRTTQCSANRVVDQPARPPAGFVVNMTFDPPGLPTSHYADIDAPYQSFVRNEPSGCWRITISDVAGLGAVVASAWFTLRDDGIRCESIWANRHFPTRRLAEHLCDWAAYLWRSEHADRDSAIAHAVDGTLSNRATQIMVIDPQTGVDQETADPTAIHWDRPDGIERVSPGSGFWLSSRQSQWHSE